MSFKSYLQELTDLTIPLSASNLIKLSALRPDEASVLLNAWPNLDLQRRRQMMQVLPDLAEDNVELNFDAIFFMALADGDAQVRRSAVRGLWEYEDRDLIDPLLGLLQHDQDAAVRAEAAQALGRFVLKAELESPRSPDVERVEEMLRRTFEQADEVSEVRGRALEAIGARSEPWVSDLIHQALTSVDRRLGLSAVHAMGRSCDLAWLPSLIAELKSDDAEMRFEAATACGAIGDESATAHILPLLDDEDHEVQEAAVGALGGIGGPEAKEALEELLAREDERLQDAVESALAEVDFDEAPLNIKMRE